MSDPPPLEDRQLINGTELAVHMVARLDCDGPESAAKDFDSAEEATWESWMGR